MYTPDVRRKAYNLFVKSGLPYEEVARRIGVSPSNLKEWGSKGKWAAQRNKHQAAIESIETTILETARLAVNKLFETYRDTGNFRSQDAFAHVKTIECLNAMLTHIGTSVEQSDGVLEFLKVLTRPKISELKVDR
ncbi:MAG: transposase [Deltaproteobacteria bacterium]|nr:transposase [Deltaproteobacteria bacterium]